jgi:hypothetical protein
VLGGYDFKGQNIADGEASTTANTLECPKHNAITNRQQLAKPNEGSDKQLDNGLGCGACSGEDDKYRNSQ